jgi:hypothetical protein
MRFGGCGFTILLVNEDDPTLGSGITITYNASSEIEEPHAIYLEDVGFGRWIYPPEAR